MKFSHSLLKVIILTLSSMISYSQSTEGQYTFVNFDKGATQRAVTSILQDNQGIIWMGTNGVGLYKYNGMEYKTYKHVATNPNTLNSSLVYSMYKDTSDNLWVGTLHGLNLYDPILDRFKEVGLNQDQHAFANIPIYAINENSKGELLIGTNEHGFLRLNIKTSETQELPIKGGYKASDLVINSIISYSKDKMLIATSRGLFSYKDQNNYIELANFETLNGLTQITQSIESLFKDSSGNLWVGTFSNGLIKISKGSDGKTIFEKFKITDKRILTLIQAPDGNVLCGTENDGLFALKSNGEVIYNYRYDKFNKSSIKSNSIWSLFVDNQDRIWIGYYNKGVGVYDKYDDKFMDIESSTNLTNSLKSTSVTGIVEGDHNKIWVAMDGGGVDIYDPIEKNFIHLSDKNNGHITGLGSSDVQTIFRDSKNNIWVGTWSSGIYFLPKNSKSFVNYNIDNTDGGLTSNRIMSFSESDKGDIYIGTFFRGLHLYNTKTRKFSPISDKPFNEVMIGESNIRIVLVDNSDTIWLGTTSGLYKVIGDQINGYSVESMTQKMFNKVGSMNSPIILSIFEDSKNNIWIGTDGGGLYKYDPISEIFVRFDESKGLTQETVASIIEDNNGNIWLGGANGLTKLDRSTGIFTNFTVDDGLLANDFNYNSVYKNADGYLFFGSYEGINYFDPNNILINTNPPKLCFTDLKIFNKSVTPSSVNSPLKKIVSETDHLILDHKASVFTLEFAGINYTRPQNNQYAYYLEGLETDWNYVGNSRSATYTNLSPGEYTFKLKGSNNDGLWNETPLTMGITVLPPWWKSNTAMLSYLILILLSGYMITRFIDQRLQTKRLIKFERDKRQQEEILNEKKIQFFTNISHEFRTPLTLILNPLRDIVENNKYQFDDTIKEKHRIMLKNTNRLIRLIDELMDFRKIHLTNIEPKASEIEMLPFIKEVASHFQDEIATKNILFDLETDGMNNRIWGDPEMLEKIIFNLLSNAFKATHENGVITIGVHCSKTPVSLPLLHETKKFTALEIIIEDTGLGIKKEEINRIFERFYRSKKMGQKYYGGSGTGIGLEVVQSFIHLHKGKIEVESEEGQGTKFKIYLPFGKDHFNPSELMTVNGKYSPKDITHLDNELGIRPKKAIQSMGNRVESVQPKRTILLVEDNPELRNYIKEELNSEYTVIEAENGKKGVELATNIIPDIIVTDIIMPEMDGIAFCSTIKQDIKTSHIPVLILSAKAMGDDRVKGIDSGADVYLNKPFEMKVLKSYLNRLIENRQNFMSRFFNDIENIQLPEKTTSIDRSFINKVLNYINENLEDSHLNVEQLAEDMHLSRSQLYRKIKAMTGITANEFIREIRLEKAKHMLESGSESISEVGFKVGFSSPSYFTKCFKAHFGILPTEVRPN
ncbi:two-component regulator propeller domain-containing protein [Maribacter sp. TH_r10]|uniref:hybrid sensor histidine kinase/response regulator transcription factor n=1 Tax=Maribacter sp. TH_r10 TaxID=3082086 RepID=UPI00295335BC|nr:two-component regulator propeller domain-containing protein [Maribacter sp. TH_r10]MDV7137402.1 two-component regulator propeller domain-containing protein [Maribacter sp. TH_r10]